MTSVNDVIQLTGTKLPSLEEVQEMVQDNKAGAISVFSGTTRDNFEGKKVLHLEYEAYEPMAEKVLWKLVAEARENWNLSHVVIMHRLATVPIGECSVVIAVSSVHRAAAIHAVEFLIDSLKEQCPIWKKEVYMDGSIWKGPCKDIHRPSDSGH